MGKIIAIGGGEIGRPGYKMETVAIDKEIIRLTGKTSPRLLFLPTASGDAQSYIDCVNGYFGDKLGCRVEALTLTRIKYSQRELADKILKTDIVYVGGGNTLKMMKLWRKLGVDELLRQAHAKGVVMAGVSAGSICWFKYGNSDSARFGKNKEASMMRVRGLGLIPALHCPHYDVEVGREESLKTMMKRTPGVAIALDNCAALVAIDGEYRIMRSKPTAQAYKVYWLKDGYFKENISGGNIAIAY
jgi:dipeptidase E